MKQFKKIHKIYNTTNNTSNLIAQKLIRNDDIICQIKMLISCVWGFNNL